MALWFRAYSETLNDPKIQMLPLDAFKAWHNALYLAGSLDSKDGNIGTLESVSFAFRETKSAVSSAFHPLIEAGLIETDGETFRVSKWSKRQYKSDTSTERVRRHRKRFRNVTETPPDTDTDTDTEQKQSKGGYAFDGLVVRLNSRDFQAWSKAYPDLDLAAELQSRDDWLRTQSDDIKKRWFNSTSNWLAKRQGEARKAREVDPMEGFIV